jgi:hypothetical protein
VVVAHPGDTSLETNARREVVAVEMASERSAESHARTLDPSRPFLGRDENPRTMKRLVNSYGIARGVETLHGYLGGGPVQEPETALWTILNRRWPRLDAHLAKYPEHSDAIGTGNPPSEISGDPRPLFDDREVITVVDGRAEKVMAHLDARRLEEILRR